MLGFVGGPIFANSAPLRFCSMSGFAAPVGADAHIGPPASVALCLCVGAALVAARVLLLPGALCFCQFVRLAQGHPAGGGGIHRIPPDRDGGQQAVSGVDFLHDIVHFYASCQIELRESIKSRKMLARIRSPLAGARGVETGGFMARMA